VEGSKTGVSGRRFCPCLGIFDPFVRHKSAGAVTLLELIGQNLTVRFGPYRGFD